MPDSAGTNRCPHCANRLVQKSAGGVVFRIEGPISVHDSICHARCYWCKADVELPLELAKSFSVETERVVVLTRAPNTRSFPK